MVDFQHVLSASAALAADLPGHVFIGGVAVYLHAVNCDAAREGAELSHDSDLMVSLWDFMTLRSSAEVVSNKRLKKHQVILDGVEFDVYVERNNNLIVPYDEVYACAVTYGDVRVAAPEHLLLLKLEALADREGTAKGDKDARDLVSVALVGKGRVRAGMLSPYLRDDHVKVLERVARSRVFEEVCGGNVHEARKLRRFFEDYVRKVSRSST